MCSSTSSDSGTPLPSAANRRPVPSPALATKLSAWKTSANGSTVSVMALGSNEPPGPGVAVGLPVDSTVGTAVGAGGLAVAVARVVGDAVGRVVGGAVGALVLDGLDDGWAEEQAATARHTVSVASDRIGPLISRAPDARASGGRPRRSSSRRPGRRDNTCAGYAPRAPSPARSPARRHRPGRPG